jgi:hypothetical protein
MRSPASVLQEKLAGKSFDASLPPSPNASNAFRKIQMPVTKIGLGSKEGDMIFMVKKYLEIVGLVVFVWVLGKNKFIIILFEIYF